MAGFSIKKIFYFKSWAILAIALSFIFLASCKHHVTVLPNRTYRMGFQNFAPKPTIDSYLQSLDLWTQHADAAIISIQVPWDSLYKGTAPDKYIINNFQSLVNYYRSKNFKLWVYIDPANGLNRAADANDLAALGKSISQPDVQKLFGRFSFLMDSLLKPDHMGLALETNAIRGISPNPIYQGVKAAANNAATLIAAYDKHVKLSVSIQADYAWGLLNGGSYMGIDKDFTDFPFIQELGISSYPYFVFDKPQDIPSIYYSRLIQGHSIPVFISEGGWSSKTVTAYTASLQKQQDYITKQGELLDGVKAIGYFQLLFSDIDPSVLPPGIPSNINLFAYIGLADTALKPKPALTNWDHICSRPLVSGN